MLNNLTNMDFDINKYQFEKRRQIADNKLKEKENKKIQINFKNSFVNEKTQLKYDKIIENNNKRNIEKQETITERETFKIIENDLTILPENNESELLIIECVNSSYKTLPNNNDTEISINNKINLNNSSVKANEMVDQNTNILPNNFIDESIDKTDKVFDTIKYDYDHYSECNDSDEHVTVTQQQTDNNYCTEGNNAEDDYEADKFDDVGENFEGKNFDENDNLNLNVYSEVKEEQAINDAAMHDYPINKNSIKEFNNINTDIECADKQENIHDEITEEIIEEVVDCHPIHPNHNNNHNKINEVKKDDIYDFYLEESVGTSRKDDIQLKLREKMKNLVYDIKDRKKGQEQNINQKKKNLLNHLKETETKASVLDKPARTHSNSKSDIVRTDASKEISTQYYKKVPISNVNNSNKNIDSLLKETQTEFSKLTENNLTFGNKILQKVIHEELAYNENFIKEDIKEDIHKLDEQDVKSIHQSILLEESQKGFNINLDEFIKENTQQDIDENEINELLNMSKENKILTNINEANNLLDKRLLVFENYQDKDE
jgi:hypothetical protein